MQNTQIIILKQKMFWFLNNVILLNLIQNWKYMHNPDPSSREGILTEVLRNPRDWIKID